MPLLLPASLSRVTDALKAAGVPYSLIGALALSAYGVPRYTSDMDLLTDAEYAGAISRVLEPLGFTPFNRSTLFLQFSSAHAGPEGPDFILMSTAQGKDILARSASVEDALAGTHPVVQPTDFIILKLMAAANNPEREIKDTADVAEVLRARAKGLIPPVFQAVDLDRVALFAEKFGKKKLWENISRTILKPKRGPAGLFVL